VGSALLATNAIALIAVPFSFSDAVAPSFAAVTVRVSVSAPRVAVTAGLNATVTKHVSPLARPVDPVTMYGPQVAGSTEVFSGVVRSQPASELDGQDTTGMGQHARIAVLDGELRRCPCGSHWLRPELRRVAYSGSAIYAARMH